MSKQTQKFLAHIIRNNKAYNFKESTIIKIVNKHNKLVNENKNRLRKKPSR